MSAVLGNIIVIAVLILAVSGACIYLYKEKKKGRRCIGCSYANTCPHKDSGTCSKDDAI